MSFEIEFFPPIWPHVKGNENKCLKKEYKLKLKNIYIVCKYGGQVPIHLFGINLLGGFREKVFFLTDARVTIALLCSSTKQSKKRRTIG